jgi:hypothetical protein
MITNEAGVQIPNPAKPIISLSWSEKPAEPAKVPKKRKVSAPIKTSTRSTKKRSRITMQVQSRTKAA